MQWSMTAEELRRAWEINASAYRHIARSPGEGRTWDVLVLTATNEKQAQGYRHELAMRSRDVGTTHAFLPATQRNIVVADPPGERIGSGGATLNALRALARELRLSRGDWSRLRVLLIHSGGLSQRLPAYSPLGKIFAPLPLLRPDGQIATLFDHLYLTVAALPERLGAGLFVLAGDVFLLFDHREVERPKAGVTSISMRVPAALGTGHGVYLRAPDGRVGGKLQKVTPEQMRAAGAMDRHGNVLIDTGLTFFDPPSTGKLAELAGVRWKGRPAKAIHEHHRLPLDLYEDISDAMSAQTQRKAFAGDARTGAMRGELFDALHEVPQWLTEVRGEFLHLGTTRQFRDAMVGRNPAPAAELFQQNVLAHVPGKLPADARVYHSLLLAKERGASARIGRGCVIEHSILHGGSQIGAGSVVSQVEAGDAPLTLAEKRLIFQVPVNVGRRALVAHVLCGVEDDFKGQFGERKCRFLNEPIERWMAASGATAQDLWNGVPEAQRTLWTAKLFPATASREIPKAMAIFDGSRAALAAWRKMARVSMQQILEWSAPARIFEHREGIGARLQAAALLDSIRAGEDRPLDALVGRFASGRAYAAAEEQLDGFASGSPRSPEQALEQARAAWSAGELRRRPDRPRERGDAAAGEALMTAAFGKIAAASEMAYRSIKVAERGPAMLRAGVKITAESPVRLDLSGGWSDTPPFCYERGGHVVNVAIDLDGHPPVIATVRTIPQRRLILWSRDLGRQIDLATASEKGGVDVHDPFALHKVALRITGLLPESGSVAAHLKRLGVGLYVTTDCRVPKGSGLGTSSILAATLLSALHAVQNRSIATAQLVEQTQLLEQRLTTGGGWQDQVGGIVGGVKSTQSEPGMPQRLAIEKLELSEAQYEVLQERLVVYYTGQQRLARNILRRVMGRWLSREPAMLELMGTLKRSAADLRDALVKSRWEAAAREIARYWQIKKELFPGSTTPAIDLLFMDVRRWHVSSGLAGAGGGGFAYFFCKSAKQADELRRVLGERLSRPGSLGTLYETHINRTGLRLHRGADSTPISVSPAGTG